MRVLAVFDCSVVVSGLGWNGNARFCLDLVFSGHAMVCVTPEIWQEYAEKIPVILASHKRPVNAAAELARLLKVVVFVHPAPLGKPRSRDRDDDGYLAVALGSGAKVIVTNDRDLLALGAPFGLSILTPIQFIHQVRGPGGS